MKLALDMSDPQILTFGEWHLPFVTADEISEYGLSDCNGELRYISAARCARTSYKTHDGRVSTLEEDIALGERLTKSRPFHASPFEHQAMPDFYIETETGEEWFQPDLHRNFTGWIQNRAYMEE